MNLLPNLPSLPSFNGFTLDPGGTGRIFTDGSFKGYTFHVSVPNVDTPHGVMGLEKVNERRLQIIDRPLYDGSDVKDFGRRAEKFTAEICFFGPNYLNEFQQFYNKCNEGSAGKLILPDLSRAVLAMYGGMTQKSSAQDGESITVSAFWYDATAKASPISKSTILSAADLQSSEANAAGARGKNALQDAFSAINNNSFVQTVLKAPLTARAISNTLASFVNYPTTLKIAALRDVGILQASITSAIASIDVIVGFIVGKNQTASSASAQNTSATAATVDPVTGQTTADFNTPVDKPKIADPLDAPSLVPAVNVPVPTVDSFAGAQSALADIISNLKGTADSLQANTQGRTADILAAIVTANGILTDLYKVAQPGTLSPYMLPYTMSLVEVLFINGMTADQVDSVFYNNAFIDDILAIPAGTVVYL